MEPETRQVYERMAKARAKMLEAEVAAAKARGFGWTSLGTSSDVPLVSLYKPPRKRGKEWETLCVCRPAKIHCDVCNEAMRAMGKRQGCIYIYMYVVKEAFVPICNVRWD